MKVKRIEDLTQTIQSGNNGFDFDSKEVQRYLSVVPSNRQYLHSKTPYYNFIHFGMNTFYDREWGDGTEDVGRFNPKKLDTDSWCKILKETGSSGVIITAKHHDGFCLWDTKMTDHCVMNSPFGKDIVAMLRKSCDKFGLKLGIYLSPWDRHEKRYGTEEYNDYFVAQLTELATNYGDIFCFWFDGACGEGKNGKKQRYDWQRYYSVIREHQPNAVISVCGPDVRWIGNEGGKVRKSEWSVIPFEAIDCEKVMDASQKDTEQASELANMDNYTQDLGSRSVLEKAKKLVWSGAEADVSITLGWFYHDDKYYRFKHKRSAKEIAKIYFNTVGANAYLLLNIPPDTDGLISQREQKTLREFTKIVSDTFKNELKIKAVSAVSKDGQRTLEKGKPFELCGEEFALKASLSEVQSVSCVEICEDILRSQRVEEFDVYAKTKSGYKRISQNTVIGLKRIIRLKRAVSTDEIVFVFKQSRSYPVIENIKIYS